MVNHRLELPIPERDFEELCIAYEGRFNLYHHFAKHYREEGKCSHLLYATNWVCKAFLCTGTTRLEDITQTNEDSEDHFTERVLVGVQIGYVAVRS